MRFCSTRWNFWGKKTNKAFGSKGVRREGESNHMKKLAAQIAKFGVVGGSAFLIDYGVMIALTELVGIHYLISSGISFAVSVIYNYILSVTWVFEVDKAKDKRKEFMLFTALSIIGLGLNQVLMWGFVDGLHVFYMLAKIVVTAIVMVYNFVTRKLFLEKKS